jgi:hypothetical protein
MKVKDLIEQLKQHDPELDVYRCEEGRGEYSQYDSEYEVYHVEETSVITHNPDQYGVELTKSGKPKKLRSRHYLKRVIKIY